MSRRAPWLVLVALLVFAGVGAWLALRKTGVTPDFAEAVRLNNVGVGQMGFFDSTVGDATGYATAAQTFEKVTQLAPDWRPGFINLGLALLNTAEPANLDRAIGVFETILRADPDDPHAHYGLGIILLYRNQTADAYPHFLAVTRIDPNDAHAWYHCGLTHPDPESAAQKACYQKALDLDPYLNAARYAVALHPHGKDDARTLALLKEQEDLVKANWETEYKIRYSEMGKYAECVGTDKAVKRPDGGPLPMYAADPPMNAALAGGAKWATAADRAAVATAGGAVLLLDYDGDGKPDILLLAAAVEGGKLRDVLLHNDGNGAFTDATAAAGLAGPPGVSGCVGDFDNDGRPDLFVAGVGKARLLRNMGGRFEDVTAAAGLDKLAGTAVGCGWLDIDQDSDLDLVLALGDGGLAVWLNVGVAPPGPPGQTLPLSAAFKAFDGLPKELAGTPAVGVVFADLDNDKDVDLLVIQGPTARPVYNDRLLRFRVGPPITGGPWTAGLAADLDHDERSELLLVGTTTLLGNDLKPTPLPTKLSQAIAFDADLDGGTDVVGLSDGKPTLLHNEGGRLVARSDAFGPVSETAVAVAVADLNGDCAPDLLLWSEGTGPTWRRSLGNGNRSVRVALSGKRDKGSNLRTNADGVGAWVTALVGPRRPAVENVTLSAGPGQSRLPVTLGIGPALRAEIVRVRWPDGVPQAELDIPTCETFAVAELNRKGTSCPVLMTWDGTRFAFVTDLLGGGAVGEMGPDGSLRPPRPEESVALAATQLVPKDGRYLLKLAEPMDEVMYLDRVRLAVVDHPAGWKVFPDERFSTGGPPPTQDLLAFRRWHLPKATDHAGRDLTATLADRDGRTADGFRPRSWLGFAEDHHVELDFGDAIADVPVGQRLFLVLAGWTDYPYPESIFAATQAGVPMQPPVLEKWANGRWETVADIGFPAGLPKVMTFEVTGKVGGPGVRLRIRTNLQIYWDQIALAPLEAVLSADAPGPGGATVRWLDPAAATLAHRGFMREVPPATLGGPVGYDDDRTEPVSVTRWAGRLTRTGDVRELLTATDDRHVLCGPGDEVTIGFPAAEPAARSRTFVLRTWGYCKDTAPFTRTGGRVGPLPFRGMSQYPYGEGEPVPAAVREYDATWNTRRVGPDR